MNAYSVSRSLDPTRSSLVTVAVDLCDTATEDTSSRTVSISGRVDSFVFLEPFYDRSVPFGILPPSSANVVSIDFVGHGPVFETRPSRSRGVNTMRREKLCGLCCIPSRIRASLAEADVPVRPKSLAAGPSVTALTKCSVHCGCNDNPRWPTSRA